MGTAVPGNSCMDTGCSNRSDKPEEFLMYRHESRVTIFSHARRHTSSLASIQGCSHLVLQYLYTETNRKWRWERPGNTRLHVLQTQKAGKKCIWLCVYSSCQLTYTHAYSKPKWQERKHIWQRIFVLSAPPLRQETLWHLSHHYL